RWPEARVIGVDRREALEAATSARAIDVASEQLDALAAADLVMLAAPVRQNLEVLARLPDVIPGDAIVSDTGSTKRDIVDAARRLPPRLTFIGGHPLGGAAAAGFANARVDLFEDRPWLFTPAGHDAGDALAR